MLITVNTLDLKRTLDTAEDFGLTARHVPLPGYHPAIKRVRVAGPEPAIRSWLSQEDYDVEAHVSGSS